MPLSAEPLDDGLILLGSMHVAPGGGRIEMVWHLIRPDGQELGQVSQANTVPAVELSGDWRELAQAIAQAGAPGVLALLRPNPGG